ncbi:hypothetical protein V6N11_027216 [Hibiscus sabdariffa]|uniref:Uncharacterized protein n=1 Tax=Hibiscus sabdariffa TaxID=183260 RepID=A0ABR2PH04_9ROSI
MAMASDDSVTITVKDPPPPSAPATLENTADSSKEDEAGISQPSDTAQEKNPQIRLSESKEASNAKSGTGTGTEEARLFSSSALSVHDTHLTAPLLQQPFSSSSFAAFSLP